MELGEDPIMVALAAIAVVVFLAGLAYVLQLTLRRPRAVAPGAEPSHDPAHRAEAKAVVSRDG